MMLLFIFRSILFKARAKKGSGNPITGDLIYAADSGNKTIREITTR